MQRIPSYWFQVMGNVLCRQVQKSVCASCLGFVSRGIPGVFPLSLDTAAGVKMKVLRLYPECPPVSSPWICQGVSDFEAAPPQPPLPCVIRQERSFSPQTPANHQRLGGMENVEVIKVKSHLFPSRNLLSRRAVSRSNSQLSVWCLPGRLCSEDPWDTAAVTLSVTGRFSLCPLQALDTGNALLTATIAW